MAHKTLIGGTAYEITGGKTLINGTGYSLVSGKTLIGGTGYDISFLSGTPLSEIAEGSIVYVNESGSPVAFYVAKHNYEPALNGTGRTLLLRKDAFSSTRAWGASGTIYANSSIDRYFNGTYKLTLDASVQTAIGTTSFYSAEAYGRNAAVSPISRSVFALSVTEYGPNSGGFDRHPAEGSMLSTSRTIRGAKIQGTTDSAIHWTRTKGDSTSLAVYMNTDNRALATNSTYGCYARPAFTLPATSAFDPETMVFVK